MKRSGSADLPLHYGYVPRWLAKRMSRLGLAITESIIADYGKLEFIRRLSDPFWFQSLGAVMGMDWHSSGITTSVMGALKKSINPLSRELGIFICGGKGKLSKETPAELMRLGERTGIDAIELVRCSKLSAKVDNTAVQDGFQLYLHNFIVTDTGEWSVVQQGMHDTNHTARRYHWHSEHVTSFVDEPHTAICGQNQGEILNLTDHHALPSRNGIMTLAIDEPDRTMREFQKLVMPHHHDVRHEDVNLKKLGATLWLTRDQQPENFEELLLLKGVGPRTLQSLALVSEVIHGSPSRFRDPARFSFAHGGKDGHPFPVPVKTYDETIGILRRAVDNAKLGVSDKSEAIKKLHEIAVRAETDFMPDTNDEQQQANFDAIVQHERNTSWTYGGRTVSGKERPPRDQDIQLKLF